MKTELPCCDTVVEVACFEKITCPNCGTIFRVRLEMVQEGTDEDWERIHRKKE